MFVTLTISVLRRILMSFINQLKEKVSQVGEHVKETTQDVISEQQKNRETNKKKKEIQQLQEKIDDLYRLIGIQFIESHPEEIREGTLFQKELTRIKELYNTQLEIQERIDAELYESKNCLSCGRKIANNHQFCTYCGALSSREEP